MAASSAAGALNAARYAALLNSSYHADREGSLDSRHRWIMFFVVLLGASSIVTAAGARGTIFVGIATTLLGAIDLTFSFSIRARKHAYLRKEYFRIAADLAMSKCSPAEAEAKMMELAGEEDPPYMAVQALAANWAMKVVYGDARSLPCKVTRFERIFRHWLHMNGRDFLAGP